VSVLLDAFALIALVAEEPAAEEVEGLLRRGDAAVTAINLAEALDVLQRVERISQERLDAIIGPLVRESLTLRVVDERMASKAAGIRARHYHRTRAPVSLADCVLVGAAETDDLVATADGPLLSIARKEGVQVKQLRR
jgi:PIN domain nuclease of toxin-antitoxin system